MHEEGFPIGITTTMKRHIQGDAQQAQLEMLRLILQNKNYKKERNNPGTIFIIIMKESGWLMNFDDIVSVIRKIWSGFHREFGDLV